MFWNIAMPANVIFFVVTLLAAVGLVATKGWHGRFSLDNAFGVQNHHKEPTPRIGGVAIVAGFGECLGIGRTGR